MTTAKRKQVAALATVAGPAKSDSPKSFLLQCREASRYCVDGLAANHLRACADDLDDAIKAFTAAVTAPNMTRLNCAWVRTVKAYSACWAGPPAHDPIGGKVDVDRAAKAA